MSNESDQIGARLLDAMKGYVSKAIASLRGEIEAKIAAIPEARQGEPGKDAEPVDVEKVIESVVARVPIPKDGKDADPVDVAVVRSTIVEEIAETIRSNRGGWLETLTALVRSTVDAIPKPKDGKDADPVHADTLRLMVREEAERAATALPKVKDGTDGTPGRDALQIEILPSIDETRSYPRGTFAEYGGGWIRSIRQTDPVTDGLEKAGWAVTLNGIAALVVSQGDNLRTFSVGAMLTNGMMSVSDFTLPVMIQRGVHRHDGEYERGDVVTSDGSQWHCEVDGTKAKPGSSPDWKLIVKRGQNGKDAEPGPRPDPAVKL